MKDYLILSTLLCIFIKGKQTNSLMVLFSFGCFNLVSIFKKNINCVSTFKKNISIRSFSQKNFINVINGLPHVSLWFFL